MTLITHFQSHAVTWKIRCSDIEFHVSVAVVLVECRHAHSMLPS